MVTHLHHRQSCVCIRQTQKLKQPLTWFITWYTEEFDDSAASVTKKITKEAEKVISVGAAAMSSNTDAAANVR